MLFLAAVALLILYPIATFVVGSFSANAPGAPFHFTLDNYVKVLTASDLGVIALRSAWISLIAAAGAIVAGTGMAWLVGRTDLPFKRAFQVFGMLPFLIPGMLVAVGWAVLGNPSVGIINEVWSHLTGLDGPLVNIYTPAGITFVLAQPGAGLAFLLLLAPLSTMDPSMSDAARLSGAKAWRVFRTIELPLLLPVLLPVAVLIFVRTMEAFEVPTILGTPAHVFLLTNEIYYRLQQLTPPDYGSANVMSVLITLFMGGLLTLQGVFTSRRRRETISGKNYRPRAIKLGRWKGVAVAMAVLYALLTSILPLGVIVFSSFFRIFGLYSAKMLTLGNYNILSDSTVRHALMNTTLLVFVCSTIAIIIGALVALGLRRRIPMYARSACEAVFLIPWAMPGLVFGIAMLWAYIRVPGMYGSIRVLMVAYITFGIAMGVRSMRGVFEQMNRDLEESASVHGAHALHVLRYIIVPLVRPGLIAGWFVLAILFSRELAASVMLYGPGSEVVSVVLLGFWERGQGNYVTVLSVVIMGALLILYMLERFLTARAAGRTRSSVT